MKLEESKAIIDAIVKLRALATDEQAAEVPVLYPAWKEDKVYATGERILYNDALYKVIKGHLSMPDCTPDAAPSLYYFIDSVRR